MNTITTHQESEAFLLCKTKTILNKPSGILISNYKMVAARNYDNLDSNSIFGKKQLAKGYLFNTNSGVEFAIRVSVFLGLFFFLF
ncbi:hypothetical protein [Hanstruepera marina]|uniref:hypothetical protein n=1 Tax=Hanstruepera marina TaxID=2873265 RepID=UPI001CA6074E|nr:hypothetical protein [Hanstruepera marina]